MSNLQNEALSEIKQEFLEDNMPIEYTAKELKEILIKEEIKIIETVTDWEGMEESTRDFMAGLIPSETHYRNIAFYMGLIKNREEGSKKIAKELRDSRGDDSAEHEGDRKEVEK